jgi:hypothetical protein
MRASSSASLAWYGCQIGLAALGDLGVFGHVAGRVDRRVVEGVDRAQAGDALAGVEAGAVRWRG